MHNWLPSHINYPAFTKELLDFFPEPILIISNEGTVLHVNQNFENLVQKEADAILGKNYGEALGCKYFEPGSTDCGNNYYCEVCEIRNILSSSIQESETTPQDGQIIVREIVINNTPITKIFKLHVKTIENEDSKVFICILKSLRKEDLESE